MKRLLYIGNNLSSSQTNPSYNRKLAAQLQSAGYSVVMASSQKNKALRLADMLCSVFKNRHQTDLVLIDVYSTQNFYYAVAVSRLARQFNLPYVNILHGGNLPSRLKNNRELSQNLFNRTTINVSPSAFLVNAFKEEGYKNIVQIPNAIDIQEYHFQARSVTTPKMLWVRSFSKIYNPLLAVEVFRSINSKYPDALLTMVGPNTDGSLQECQELANCHDLPVTFTGKLSKAEWVELAQNYNLFINTTNVDNTPVSVLEAMALGLAVISTNVGGMPYLIKDGKDGLLVPTNETEGFVKAIENLIDHPDLVQKITTNARTKVEQYDWSIILPQWINLIESMVND